MSRLCGEFNVFKFPTGEVHCKLMDRSRAALAMMDMPLVRVPMRTVDNRDLTINDYLMVAALICDVVGRLRSHKPFDLLLPYLPYSRQDRVTSAEEPFSLKVVGRFLNTLPCRKIFTLDAHSDVAGACIDNLVNIDVGKLWINCSAKYFSFSAFHENRTLVIPDQGAFKKLSKYSDQFKNVVFGIKSRDTDTGHLKLVDIIGDVQAQNCLIVDDICDGGGTFVALANELYKRGANKVELAVTHGVFTKGLKPLVDARIKLVYTTDSFTPVYDNYCGVLIVQPLESIFERMDTDL